MEKERDGALTPFGRARWTVVGCLGIVALWCSVFLSYRRAIPPSEDLHGTFAAGGFPFVAFAYPVPPMGSDLPPIGSLAPFLANLVFWTLAAAVLSFAVRRELLRARPFRRLAAALAVSTSVIGAFYLLLQFD